MELLSPERALALLQPGVARAHGRITVADAAAATGMAMEDARTGLEALMHRFDCRLQVTDSGEILYDFGPSLRRRGRRTWNEIVSALGSWAWRAFTVGFKMWIWVMLVAYFVTFIAILLAIMVSGRSSKGVGKLGRIFDGFADLFVFGGRTMILVDGLDKRGYQHKTYAQQQRRKREETEPKKRIVQSVYDFVFGPKRASFELYAYEKEVVAWLRAQRGILTTAEIVALAGWTFDDAERRMADYLTRFNGEAAITDDGVIVGRFDRLLATGDGAIEGGKVELFWNEYEAPWLQTGNTGGSNALIAGMNVFNLVMAFVMLGLSLRTSDVGWLIGTLMSESTVRIVFGVVPLLFSLLFFTVPLLRGPLTERRERARLHRNRVRRVLRAVFDLSGAPVTIEQIAGCVNVPGMEKLSSDELGTLLEHVLPRYGGRVDLDDNGTAWYVFDRIARESAAAQQVRSQTAGRTELGPIIFDTGPPTVHIAPDGKLEKGVTPDTGAPPD
jgi:hypothetical protein